MKPPICTVCKTQFERTYTTTQKVCSPYCAMKDATAKREKKEHREQEKQAKMDRKELRARKEALRPKSYYIKQAQASFNAFIRKRDEGDDCISCQKPPKKINCGHYKTTASQPSLRFHPFNGNIQCEHCNTWKSGAIDLYRPNLIKKIGEENVLWLETEQTRQDLTIDEIKEIGAYYKERLKLLKEGEL